jgi:ABC-type branched-subunit amino acid transport system substrate-binding protein
MDLLRIRIVTSLCACFVLLGATLHPLVGAQSGPPSRALLCIFGRWETCAPHAAFAVRYNAHRYPDTQWDVKLLWPATNLREVVQTFLTNGTDCDVLTLAASSPDSLALSPLVLPNVAWVDGSATSTELSDTATHPTFNRVIPTDAIGAGGAAILAHDFGWTLANVVFVDTAYGRSVAEGFTNRFRALGGQVEFMRSFSDAASVSEVESALTPILEQAKSRVIFVAGATDNAYLYFEASKLWTKVILIFSENACTPATMERFPGTFCTTYGTVPALEAAYRKAFAARDKAAEVAFFRDVFTDAELSNTDTMDIYSFLTADAVRVSMEAINNYWKADHTLYPTMSSVVKTVAFDDGLTGAVGFNGNDREEALLYFFNTYPNASNTSQTILSASGFIVNGTIEAGDKALFYAIDNIGYSNIPPSGLKPILQAKVAFPGWIFAIVVPAVLLLAAFTGYQLRRRSILARCPLDSHQPYACMFVSVKNEDAVRDRHPNDAATAFAAIAAFTRQAVRKTGCHETRRINETTVLIVSKTPEQAMQCAAIVQRTAADYSWDTILHRGQAARAPNTAVGADNRSNASSRHTKRSKKSQHSHKSMTGTTQTRNSADTRGEHAGLVIPQLNVGIQYGLGEIDRDDDTGAISYHGVVVDQAALIADAAIGNHIVVSERLAEVLIETGYVVDGTLSEYRSITVAATSSNGHQSRKKEEKISLQTFMPSNYPLAQSVQDRLATAASASEGDEGCGGIATALSQADKGMARRRVAVACVCIPALMNSDNALNDVEHANRITRTMTDLSEVAKQHKGKFQCVADGRIYIAINTSGPLVSQPETRAAHIAHTIIHDLALVDVPAYRGVSIGIATGRSMEGTVAGFRASMGSVMNTARIMQQLAARLDVPCLSDDRAYDDLNASYHVVTVDAIAIPLSCDARQPPRISRVVALVEQRDNAAEGEWLYHMAKGDTSSGGGTPAAGTAEGAWIGVMKGTLPQETFAALPESTSDVGMPPSALRTRQEQSQARLAAMVEAGSLEVYAKRRSCELDVVY